MTTDSGGKPSLGVEIITAFTHIVIGNRIWVSGAVITVYEWLITLDMDIRLTWCKDTNRKPKVLVKVLYLVNRYGVVADLILAWLNSHAMTAGTCTNVVRAFWATTILGTFISEYILLLRVRAVWKMNKIVIFTLAMTHIGLMTYMLTSIYLELRSVEFPTPLPFGSCLADSRGLTLWIGYALLFIYDTAMIVLMVYPTIKEYKFSHGRTSGLIRLVYDEGITFYVFTLLCDVVSLALQQTAPEDIFTFTTPVRILRSILATRTILHIREYTYQENALGSTTEAMSSIRFNRSRSEGEIEALET